MEFVSYLGIIISAIAILLTVMNFLFANAATVWARLVTQNLPEGTLFDYPDNKLGPNRFGEGGVIANDYLNLVISNGGPGVARLLKWHIKGPHGSECGELPYLGKNSEIIVRGYIGKYHTIEEIRQNSYDVVVQHKPVLGIRSKYILLHFDGSGDMKSFSQKKMKK